MAELSEEAITTAQQQLEHERRAGVSVVGYFDPEYPPRLRLLSSPPPILYVRGSLPDPSQPALAVIGTRRPSPYGVQATKAMTLSAASQQVVIVSGLALGIDGVAHEAAIEGGVATVAILGGGLDDVSPRRHRNLAERIIRHEGALVSEQPFGVTPEARTLVARNRIQVGIADALLVGQSPVKSGSMHTVRFAAEQGKRIFCPAPDGSPASEGMDVLLNQPARALPELLPAWKAAGALARRLGAQPVATRVDPEDAAKWAATLSLGEPSGGGRTGPGEQLTLEDP